MDDTLFQYTLFVLATFAAAIIAALAGFAFGLVAAAMWLYVLTPVQTATLIVGYGLIVQGVSVWKLRHALDWSRLWPFMVGAAVGVPFGVLTLGWADVAQIRLGIGIFLIVYSIYALLRVSLAPVRNAGVGLDSSVGFLNGVLGGVSGLAGIAVVIWCGLRGWSKDVQRAVFQPVGVATFAMTAVWLGATGTTAAGTASLFLLGLPALLLGTWLGLKLYDRVDETSFRQVVLVLLLLSGFGLAISFYRS